MKISPVFVRHPARRLTRWAVLAAAMAASAGHAQVREALPPLDVHASGFFLNDKGDVLTARHVVADCRAVYVVKDSRVVQAQVAALSQSLDLAVLGTALKPYLSATFAQTAPAPHSSIGVFTEAYGVLQRLPNRATLLSNAMTIPASGGDEENGLQLISGAQPGASGSGVVGASGLLLGVVVERVASGPGASGRVLSRAATAAGAPTGATQVHAISAAQVKQFLRDSGIPFSESDAPQIGPMQSPAARASTLAVGVICG